jgi:hypothetical protein
MHLDLPHIIFLNGPPGSGKKTLANLITTNDSNTYLETFGDPLRQMVYTTFFPEEGPIDYSLDLFDPTIKNENLFLKAKLDFEDRDLADIPNLDIRDTMIGFADYLRTSFGPDLLGRLLFKRIVDQTMYYHHFVITDTYFPEEAKFIASRVGPDQCHLIRIHRAGCEFRRDGRNYISLPEVQTLDIHNDGAPDQMLDIIAAEFRPAGVGINKL